MTRHLLSILFLLAVVFNGFTQDIHLAQTNMTPLLINPANAGSEYTMRGILNYRNQWSSVGEPFTTMMASYDMNFKKTSASKRNFGYFGGGIFAFKDQAGDSHLKTTQINLTIDYHVNLDAKNTLGLGIQGGYFQRSADINNLTWGAQFDGYQQNPSYATGEGSNFTGFSFGSTDYTSGLVWTYRNNANYNSGNKLFLTSGISLNHLTKPNFETTYINPDRLNYRFIWFGSGIIGINPNISILPYLMYSKQGSIYEAMFGSNVLYLFKQASKYTNNIKGMAIGGGAYYRWNDALILTLITQYANYTFEFSYDINTSTLKNASGGKGAFELSLRYVYPNPFGGEKSRSRFN